jgi:NAD(P)-dependent dehydrogenase (short-subunit alcohol dehydrogenase family)
MNLGLRDRVAVVTGAAGAIGGSIAEHLAAEGARVALWDIAGPAADEKAHKILEAGGTAHAEACDVTDAESIRGALEATLTALEAVDILVNCAGGSRKETTTAPDHSFFDISPEDQQRVMALNYGSTVYPCQAVGRVFAQRKRGVVLNIGSIAGILPLSRALTYSDGKAAVTSFTRWLAVHMAREYSPEIRVNALAPGWLLTEQNRFLLLDEETGSDTERGATIKRNVPMGRYGRPEEIAEAALWLVSDRAGFVTGAVIPVDGGFTAFCGV